jgi:peptidyl-prolyl cis-trans isomerase C
MHLFRFTGLLLAAMALFAQTSAPQAQGAPGAQHNVVMDIKPVPTAELLASKPLTPEEAKKVVITIGDITVTAGEFNAYVDTLPPQVREYARTVNKGKFAENIVKVKLLAAEARRENLHQDPRVQAQMTFQNESLLANHAFEKAIAAVRIDESLLREYYDKHRPEYERVRARHILIRMSGSPMPAPQGKKDLSSDEALQKVQALRKRIVAGEEFAKVAKEESDDTNSAAKGGDLDFVKRGQLVPEFEQVAFALKPGTLSEPVRTPYGFHLIRVDQHELKSLEEMKPEIEKRLRPELANKMLTERLSKAQVKVDENFFGPVNLGDGPVTPAASAPAAK